MENKKIDKIQELKYDLLILKPKQKTALIIKEEYSRILDEYKNGVINVGECFDYEIMHCSKFYLNSKDNIF